MATMEDIEKKLDEIKGSVSEISEFVSKASTFEKRIGRLESQHKAQSPKRHKVISFIAGILGGVIILGAFLYLLWYSTAIQPENKELSISLTINAGEAVAGILVGIAAMIAALAYSGRSTTPGDREG